eukprot:1623653-Rhodomonas_salina.1
MIIEQYENRVPKFLRLVGDRIGPGAPGLRARGWSAIDAPGGAAFAGERGRAPSVCIARGRAWN